MCASVLLLFLPCAMGMLKTGIGVGKLLRCADEHRSPCRVKINTNNLNSFQATEDFEVCACSNDRRCLNNWSTTADSVQSVSLRSETSTTQYNMMFCHKWRNRLVHRCKRNDTALQIAGFRDVPTNFVFYKCRCRAGAPLVLTSRERANNLVYEKYTCANFLNHVAQTMERVVSCLQKAAVSAPFGTTHPTKPHCHHGQSCATRSHNNTMYHCQCANRCQVDATESGQALCH